MATIKRFEDLKIWQEARRLSQEIIKISKTTAIKKDFKLSSQIKDAAGSVMDNIAEGFERDGTLEFRQFLAIAKASAAEVRSQLYRVYDNAYISQDVLEQLTTDFSILNRMIANFIHYLNNTDFKGNKFKSVQE